MVREVTIGKSVNLPTGAKLLADRDNVNIRQLYVHAKENRVKLYEGCIARFISEILLHLGEPHFTISEEWIIKAIEADRKNGMILDVGRDFGVYGQLLVIEGHLTKDSEALERSVKIFQECGADGWAQKYKAVLS